MEAKTIKTSFFDLKQFDIIVIAGEKYMISNINQPCFSSSYGYLEISKKPDEGEFPNYERYQTCVTKYFDKLDI